MWSVLKRVRRAQLVFLNMSCYSAIGVAPAVWFICKAARRPLALRFFGGTLPELYRGYGRAARRLADRPFCVVRWCIWRPIICSARSATRSTFVGCPIRGILRPSAGAGARRFASWSSRPSCGWTRDWPKRWRRAARCPRVAGSTFFGPVMRDTDLSLFAGHPRAAYGGVLEPGEMPRVLSEHDLLLFPSYRRHETYPGIIVEASQCGVPVIAAKWGDVPEIVRHERDGLLVEPRSAADLQAAIERLLDDPALYRRLCAGARGAGGTLPQRRLVRPGGAGLARPVRLAGARYGAGRPLIFRKHREDGRRPQCSRRPLAAEQTRDRAPQARHVGAPEQQRGAQRQSSRSSGT